MLQNYLSPPAYRLLQVEKIKSKSDLPATDNWREWLYSLFPNYVSAPFADRHIQLWDWIEMIIPGVRPRPLVALWPRGGAKSTSSELGAVRVGARRVRRYIWYVSGTQEQADKHVESIAALLESDTLAHKHPRLAERMVGKYGNSKGWRRNRLRTESGLTVDALGLDIGSRGAKVEEFRPDMMILDDIDDLHDSMETTQKKIDTLTKTVLPAGSNDCAVLFIQNLIFSDSIASRLADGRAEFLADRDISGPFKAVDDLTYEQREGRFIITGGVATWEGQNLEICQSQIDTWGLTPFLQEAQHDVEKTGGIWDHIEFQHCDYDDLPALVRCAVWVDPAVTSTDQSDCQGIQADGIDEKKNIYRLYSWEGIDSPESTLQRAILKALEIKADHVGVETDQGGDTWESVYKRSCDAIQTRAVERWEAERAARIERGETIDEKEEPPKINFPRFVSDKAGAGYGSKVERNQRMLTAYERGKITHVRGTHAALERSLRRFPQKPLDLSDAAFWSWNDLSGPTGVFFR